MQAGLSMALGAFLAGLFLAETEFSLQVESDIAPYRGLLLGVFFMTVGPHSCIYKTHLSLIHTIYTLIVALEVSYWILHIKNPHERECV